MSYNDHKHLRGVTIEYTGDASHLHPETFLVNVFDLGKFFLSLNKHVVTINSSYRVLSIREVK